MIRRPPRSTQSRSSAASDVYKRQSLKIIIPRESKNANNTTNSCGPHSFHNMLFRRASRNVSKHNILNNGLADYFLKKMAERVGFEPTRPFGGPHALQACALNQTCLLYTSPSPRD